MWISKLSIFCCNVTILESPFPVYWWKTPAVLHDPEYKDAGMEYGETDKWLNSLSHDTIKCFMNFYEAFFFC